MIFCIRVSSPKGNPLIAIEIMCQILSRQPSNDIRHSSISLLTQIFLVGAFKKIDMVLAPWGRRGSPEDLERTRLTLSFF